MAKAQFKHFLLLHLIVFIWGWSPVLGKAISASALQLVWYRIGITILALLAYVLITKKPMLITKRDLGQLFLVGAIIAFHWFCFYEAIRVSNASVTLVAFSTGTLFTAIIEPLLYKRRFNVLEIVFGLIIIGAISLIGQIDPKYHWGIIYGVLAAFTSSLFSVWNGLLVKRLKSEIISTYELIGGFVALSIFLFFHGDFSGSINGHSFFALSSNDIWFLLILAVVGTAFPFIASVNLMKHINPFTITLTVNLETVYGIIISVILWPETEKMPALFYVCASIILAVIAANAWLKVKINR